ncbi:MAG: trehalose-6-phosphate synthase [Vicinamibacteria bacterium]|nr:trehalose-6-phosphate synthase [Vicinamibacteria bacterium]
MRQPLRFLIMLVAGLGLLTWGAFLVMQATTKNWVERDLTLRARLAVNGASHILAEGLRAEKPAELKTVLTNLVRDERILGVSACAPDGQLVATAGVAPVDFGCLQVTPFVFPKGAPLGSPPLEWEHVAGIRGGRAHLNGLAVMDESGPAGLVILVHDLSFAERRDAEGRNLLLVAFFLLSLCAALVTIIAVRLSWRSWTQRLRRMLKGDEETDEFRPLLRDVRALVDEIMTERDADGEGGAWTADRLKQALRRNLHGEKIVIVSNREPYIHERQSDGSIRVLHPASGLVTALEPVMRACSGVWVAHGSGTADRDVVDAHARVMVPPGEALYPLRRVWFTEEQEKGYYYGFSNEGLWPLCHVAHTRPIFRTSDWIHYGEVNQKFADAVCDEAEIEDPIVLIQDYHLALAPRMIREKLPRATVIGFWHIPWPNADRFGICPWREEILDGMLGASMLGFHTQGHCNNFMDSVDRYLESRIDREKQAVVQLGRSTQIRPYPISLEWPVRWLKDLPPVPECRRGVFEELGLSEDALLGVGVDRLDYTKGIEERLQAVERLLELRPELLGRFVFVQLAAPSRTAIDRYRVLNESVEAIAKRVNDRFGSGSYRPIILKRAHHEPPTVFRYYRAADLCYVSSLDDGMNLVAKEFVAAREDEKGVLVLSQFTGAARELTESLVVNPYDLDQSAEAMAAALMMPIEEQRARLRSMRAYVAEFNIYRWAGRMLRDAARLRRRDRLSGRLNDQYSARFTGAES